MVWFCIDCNFHNGCCEVGLFVLLDLFDHQSSMSTIVFIRQFKGIFMSSRRLQYCSCLIVGRIKSMNIQLIYCSYELEQLYGLFFRCFVMLLFSFAADLPHNRRKEERRKTIHWPMKERHDVHLYLSMSLDQSLYSTLTIMTEGILITFMYIIESIYVMHCFRYYNYITFQIYGGYARGVVSSKNCQQPLLSTVVSGKRIVFTQR